MELLVHSYCLKGARQEPVLPPVTLKPETSTLTVAELIRLAVTEQIATLSVQHWLEQVSVGEMLDRQYLSERDIARQARQGTVAMPQAEAPLELDVDIEIEHALRGFEARAFRVLHNGTMLNSLNETIDLSPPSTLAFIRLMPLIGG